MTGLYVDSIKDKSNTKTLATLSSSAVTLNSDVVFPTGMLIGSGVKIINTLTDQSISTETETALTDYYEITVGTGNTIMFGVSLYGSCNISSGSDDNRDGQIRLYHNTSGVSRTADSSLGTAVGKYLFGRRLVSPSSSSSYSFISFNQQVAFESTATTHHIGCTFKVLSTNTTLTIGSDSDYPIYIYYYEFKGDVLT